MRALSIFATAAIVFCTSLAAADGPRLIRSLSGPSGKVVGSKFVFDETRSRFVYPQDRTLTIYFEWEAPAGDHVLSANWKRPDGRVVSISPDVKIQTQSSFLSCYWMFMITPEGPNGIWSVDVRVDGQPAGSYSFELAGLQEPRRESPAPPQKAPSLDDIYKAVGPSLVWVYKQDETGRRVDESTGFVWAAGQVVTAFQAIDSAASLEVEFASGRKATVRSVLACSRLGDWAILEADTGSAAAVVRGKPQDIAVGDRLIVFNVEGGARLIGGVDIAGRETRKEYGDRIRISPSLVGEAAGGPLLDLFGHAVGILGGSLTPGGRFGEVMNVSPGLFHSFSSAAAATPVSMVPATVADAPKSLDELRATGVLSAPISAMPEFLYGGTSNSLAKGATDLPHEVSDFTTHDAQVYVYSLWARKGKQSKGEVSGSVYDAMNRLLVNVASKKINLSVSPTRVAFSFSPAAMPSGIYRVDLNWDGKPAWRTFVRITD